MSSPAVEAFADAVALPEDVLDLGLAALMLAQGADADLDVGIYLDELDGLAEGIEGAHGLRRRLFDDCGFAGNMADYYDPENSFLNRVIERRTGIPITLCVVTIEVGRRAGVPLEAIGMPGHFLVRDPVGDIYIDPYGGGMLLDERGCEAVFRAVTGDDDVIFDAQMLPVASKRAVLARMLTNLKAIYTQDAAWSDLEWVLRMRLALPETSSRDLVQLGETMALQGRVREAAKELEARAAAYPGAEDALADAARSLLARLN